MEEIKVNLMVNKSGSGSVNYRLRLPTSWVKQLNLEKVTLKFDGKCIIITKTEEEEKC